MKKIINLISICVCFSFVTVKAETYNYQERVESWVISGEKDKITHKPLICVAGTKNDNKSKLGLALADSIDGVMVIITTKNWYKIKGKNITLRFQTDVGKPGMIVGSIIEKGKIHLNTDKSFIKTLRAAKYVVFNQNLFTEKFSMKGSYKALKKLLACADKNTNLSNKPFLY